MCRKCKTKTRQFAEALAQAEAKTEGRKKYAVYTRTFADGVNYPFVGKIATIKKDESICCYYLPDGTKVDKDV